MFKVTDLVTSFKDLVQWLLVKLAEDLCRQVESVLEEIESQYKRDESLKGWESIGQRERTLVSLFGMEIRFRRRGYRRRQPDGKWAYRYPLDEMLGLLPEERFCPLVQELAVDLATKMSFREAASCLQERFGIPVSHQEIHRWLQEAGQDRDREFREEVQAVFERGQVLEGEGRGADAVVIEADGIFLPLQREQQKVMELKRGVMHEGWEAESPSGTRHRLVNKAAWAGLLPTEEFWERGQIRFAQRYDSEKVGRVVVNGDGAEWIKRAKQYFADAELYLDRFHRNRAIREALGFSPELVRRALKAVGQQDLKALQQVLSEGLATAPGEEEARRVRELRRYLKANWAGLLDWRSGPQPVPEGARGLGASEAEINHVLAVRMTKRGMSWRATGAHHMAPLRCLHAEGHLRAWLAVWQKRRWPAIQAVDRRHAPSRVIEKLSTTDPTEWLAARMPLLATAAGNSELGRSLKQIARCVPTSELIPRSQPMPWRTPARSEGHASA
ncbi:MAG: ISLre2 family transposase [Symbiobacterium sp.]|uniref:ISLre2 family transposase n=1 Tax=Symbiobacterium sp. TaxID=1971213 RepID=UPI0034639F39